MFEEMRTGLLLQRAAFHRGSFFSAKQFLHLATLGAAETLGIADQVGSLEIGKKADIVAVDLVRSPQIPTSEPESALVHTAYRSNIRMTMVGGKELYTDGAWAHTDSELIRARNDKIRTKLRV
jgi:5-methylthioadenosine/S-adenosylhomocysteine deaminase